MYFFHVCLTHVTFATTGSADQKPIYIQTGDKFWAVDAIMQLAIVGICKDEIITKKLPF